MSESPQPTTPRQSTWAAITAYAKPKPMLMLGLGYATGIPYLLIGDTLNAWLRVDNVSLSVIGFFILVSFSYALKFMWAPLIDRLDIPFLTAKLGHRRSWMIVLQVLIALSLMAIAASDPRTQLIQLALFATLTGFFGATHDIVLDAWRIEAAETREELSVMTAAYQWGYRTAFIVSGAVPLLLATRIGWPAAYAIMAAMIGLGWICVWFAPKGAPHTPRAIHYEGVPIRPILEGFEWIVRGLIIVAAAVIMGSGLTGKPDLIDGILGLAGIQHKPFDILFTTPATGWMLQIPFALGGLCLMIGACWPLPWKTRPGAYFHTAFILPMEDFFKRFDKWAVFILLLICVYRVSEFTLNIANPYYLDLGFSLDAVGAMRKFYGAAMTMVGVVISGWIMARMGLRTALIVGAVTGPLSHVGFMILACAGHNFEALALALALDNICASIQGTVLIVYMSTLVSAEFTAPQYALFSSFYAILGKLVASQSGRIVESSAKAADTGGFSALFKGLMGHLTPDAYVTAAQKLGVSVPAMGAGYFAFFAYTIVVGFIAVAMSVWLFVRYKPQATEAPAALDG
ncbi:AmpG family muropeptide MFS transporter [Asticcacaulis solisilvae]|uniref:AmpG family muropeptide MFS transporter n=1 Tax=Asticcacaulis solisilvae TaxID=1217274 RepID=UPI003FD7BDA1